MKAQSLNKEQKAKLLEMANGLYEEEKIEFFLDVPKGLNKNHTFLMGFLDGNDYIPNCDVYMHWFEFCIKCIAPKVTSSNLVIIAGTIAGRLENSNVNGKQDHLVDYLYTLWKASK